MWVASELADLKFHWGSAYRIWYDGRWHAKRMRPGSEELVALGHKTLRLLIRDDYQEAKASGAASPSRTLL